MEIIFIDVACLSTSVLIWHLVSCRCLLDDGTLDWIPLYLLPVKHNPSSQIDTLDDQIIFASLEGLGVEGVVKGFMVM